MLQVRFQVEQSRDALQRQLAALDGQLHVAQARQEEAQADNQVGLCAAQHRVHAPGHTKGLTCSFY